VRKLPERLWLALEGVRDHGGFATAPQVAAVLSIQPTTALSRLYKLKRLGLVLQSAINGKVFGWQIADEKDFARCRRRAAEQERAQR